MTELQILPYQHQTQMEALSQIWLDASRIGHPFIGEAALQMQQQLVETQYLPKAETFVAWQDGAPAGFISLLGEFIGGLFVAPKAQGKGIGRALVQHVLRGRSGLELEVYTQNAQAYGFYTHLGFCELSRRSHDADGMPFENARLRIDCA